MYVYKIIALLLKMSKGGSEHFVNKNVLVTNHIIEESYFILSTDANIW